jgi:hypothetical protein
LVFLYEAFEFCELVSKVLDLIHHVFHVPKICCFSGNVRWLRDQFSVGVTPVPHVVAVESDEPIFVYPILQTAVNLNE